MAQRLQKSAPFDVDFHGSFDCRKVPGKAPSGPLAGCPEALDFLELSKAEDSSRKLYQARGQEASFGALFPPPFTGEVASLFRGEREGASRRLV
jgi:hypothetical protein